MQTCPSCGYNQNRDTAKFCSNCAAPLAPMPVTCALCGAQNIPGARFCSNCANPLTSTPLVNTTGIIPPNTLLALRYIITRKLGQGGMGAVYQAQDARLPGKWWAVKEMSNAQIADPVERANAVTAFQREAQILATLDHPNLPKVADYFSEQGKQYLVMDFIEGQTLEQIVTATPGFLPEPTVLGWIEQVCEVLAYLHACQPPIIFRDLKPANIMLARDGRIKLIDFGIVRFFQAGKKRDTAAYGTMGYAAPEQFGTGQTDARSDIYSLGVTLHNLLTKFDPASAPFNLPPARNINPLVSAQTEQVIACATKSAQHERFQSAREMKTALFQIQPAPVRPVSQPIAPQLTVPVPPPQIPPGMILIPAGEFTMGSNDERDNEKPPHKVYLDAYYISCYPVTNAEYKKFVDATNYRVPFETGDWAKRYSWDPQTRTFPTGRANHPVVLVSWEDTNAYVQWAGMRLPTEAEWEKAARGTDGRKYPWGNTFDKNLLNSSESGIGGTTPVGKYSPQGDSSYGMADMAGNVWEWCADWYDANYYASSPRNNPAGPSTGQYRVLRGGAWNVNRRSAHVAFRLYRTPSLSDGDLGFRCAKSV